MDNKIAVTTEHEAFVMIGTYLLRPDSTVKIDGKECFVYSAESIRSIIVMINKIQEQRTGVIFK